NCFCKKDWMPYKVNGAKRDVPNGGCYYPFSMPSVQIRANRTCYRKNDAVLVLDEDSEKDAFLMKAFPPNTKLWLGLQYKGDHWTWPGGYSAGFTNWAPGQPNYEAGNCAYMQLYPGSKSAWFTDDCYSDHYYMCQAKPCDSTKYCPAE
ncbi:lectin C-type domain protein, partial [Teladorsagia circumcincta]